MADRCFPIFGLFTPRMVSPPTSLGNVVQKVHLGNTMIVNGFGDTLANDA